MANLLRRCQPWIRDGCDRATWTGGEVDIHRVSFLVSGPSQPRRLDGGPAAAACSQNSIRVTSLSGLGPRSCPADEQDRLHDQKPNCNTHEQRRQRVGAVLSPAVVAVVDQQGKRLRFPGKVG